MDAGLEADEAAISHRRLNVDLEKENTSMKIKTTVKAGMLAC